MDIKIKTLNVKILDYCEYYDQDVNQAQGLLILQVCCGPPNPSKI